MTLVDQETRVVVQGITGTAARHHTELMIQYGTNIVAGVRPGAAGQKVEGVPVYDSVADAVQAQRANASILFVPARALKAAAFEAMAAGVKLLVLVPEHVPLHDAMIVVEEANRCGVHLVGPNTPGLICPAARCKMGFVPDQYFAPGPVGVASRSGTLTYEIVSRLTLAGIGQSTVVGVGGDRIVGTTFAKMLELFEADTQTESIVLVGEIGGTMEEEAAELICSGKVTKPVTSFLAGRNVPEGKRMGHAGAIVASGRGSIKSKLEAFAKAGVEVAEVPADVVPLVRQTLAF